MITELLIAYVIGFVAFLPGLRYLSGHVPGDDIGSGVRWTAAAMISLLWPLIVVVFFVRHVLSILVPWWLPPVKLAAFLEHQRMTQVAGDNSTQVRSVGDAHIRITPSFSGVADNISWEAEQRRAASQQGKNLR
ncbi:hypothetical protein SEA_BRUTONGASTER_109 [Gordonia phage BrutonGaster]|uniref:Uncharacterized protein n=1 Tax=Gordonia phage BrutonGaster TaxID=2530116 RepID=A0A482JN80_9CAUD|nr:hypothetical protein HOV26_gp073 [Gordonia phage BrutonGaster]QBP33324.1 hypothetical protein SEA_BRUTONGASTER_109 [Gordonia phage BrutonGaster]